MFENDKPTAQSNLAQNIYENANREINRLRKKLTIKNIEIKRLRAVLQEIANLRDDSTSAATIAQRMLELS